MVCCAVQDALYVDVSGKPIRSYSQYADRGGAGRHAGTCVALQLLVGVCCTTD